jgi:hypothetical protein
LKLEPGQIDSHYPIKIAITLNPFKSRIADGETTMLVELWRTVSLTRSFAYTVAAMRKCCKGRHLRGRENLKIVLHADINVLPKVEIEEHAVKVCGSVYCS